MAKVSCASRPDSQMDCAHVFGDWMLNVGTTECLCTCAQEIVATLGAAQGTQNASCRVYHQRREELASQRTAVQKFACINARITTASVSVKSVLSVWAQEPSAHEHEVPVIDSLPLSYQRQHRITIRRIGARKVKLQRAPLLQCLPP